MNSQDEKQIMADAEENSRFKIDDVSLNLFKPDNAFRKTCLFIAEHKLRYPVRTRVHDTVRLFPRILHLY